MYVHIIRAILHGCASGLKRKAKESSQRITTCRESCVLQAEKEAGSLVYHNKANLADEIEQAVIGEQNDGGDAGLGCGCDTTVLSRATVNNGDERAVIKTSTSPSIIGSLFSRGAQSRESKAENKCTNDRGSKVMLSAEKVLVGLLRKP